MRTGALAWAPAAFLLRKKLTLERFGGAPKPAPQQQQRSGSILPPFLLRPGALARRRKLAFRAPQKKQRSGSILPPFYSGSVLFARRRKLAFPPNQRSGSILRCLLHRVVRMGPGAFSSENRIRKECQQFLGFEYQKRIDSIFSSRLGSGAFSEPKIGSERGARIA